METLVRALGAAKSRQNVEAAVALQHEDMRLDTPALGSVVEGRAANAAALARFFAWFPDYHVTLAGSAPVDSAAGAGGRELVAWGVVRLTWTGARLGVVPNGRRAELPGFFRFTFRDDRIASEYFLFDLATLCAQSGVSTDAVRARLFSQAAARASATSDSAARDVGERLPARPAA